MRSTELLFVYGIGMCILFSGCKPEDERRREAEAASAVAQTPAPPPMPDQVAKTGVGVKGDSLNDIKENDPRNIIAGPVKSLFAFQQRAVFDMQIPKAVDLFKATNGRDPKSHDEYMRDIIKANQIQLPELPQGMVYRYHTDTHELWVEAEKK
ncbi:MAG: hypothetical protein ABL921_01730 [Pirellula sp.]